MASKLHVVGVRHHSPACARLVLATLEAVKPAVVLVEGPADFNDRISELSLDHEPPIAIFTHYLTEDGPVSCFTPFCAFSPEWVALQWGISNNAVVRFADLPAWSKAFSGVENRYRDEDDRYERAALALCQRTGMGDLDALWDHLFEGKHPDELGPALQTYFREIRGDAEPDEREALREEFMRAYISWALGIGDVVFICGGWHAPSLVDIMEGGAEPVSPQPVLSGGSHLVPWTNARLDSFAGYQAGMPSPFWWELEWTLGKNAADAMIDRLLAALRKREQKPTVADHIALRTAISTLAALRGHEAPKRIDVLDGMLSALVREALPGPPPWSRRGRITGDLHPIVATALRTFTGDRVGVLSRKTARPPLLRDVEEALAKQELVPGKMPQKVKLDWKHEGQREKLRLLHRLRILEIPGFVRESGPAWGTDAKMAEVWRIFFTFDQEPAIIEASRWGATVEGAVSFCLSHRLLSAERLDLRVLLLGDAAFAGLTNIAGEAAELVGIGIAKAASLGALGPAMDKLLALWRHGEWLGYVGAPLLTPILRALAERSMSLLGGISGTDLLPSDLVAIRALVPVLRHGDALGLFADDTQSALKRRASDVNAPAMLRGAALGALWSLGEGDAPVDSAVEAALLASSEGRLGDYLAGLFALARGPALRDGELIGVIDATLSKLDDDVFLVLLPSMRLAFSWFPPAERGRLGSLLSARWGKKANATWIGEVPAPVLEAGLRLDARVMDWGKKLGVLE